MYSVRGTCTGLLRAFDKHMNLLLVDVQEDYTSLVPDRDPGPKPEARGAETDNSKKGETDDSRDMRKLRAERGGEYDARTSGSGGDRMTVQPRGNFGTRKNVPWEARGGSRFDAYPDKTETEEGEMVRGKVGLSGAMRGAAKIPDPRRVGVEGESGRGTGGKGVVVKKWDTVGDDRANSSRTGGSGSGKARDDPAQNVAGSGKGVGRGGEEEEEEARRSNAKPGRRRSRHKGPWCGDFVSVRRQRFLKQLLIRGDNVVMIWEAPRF